MATTAQLLPGLHHVENEDGGKNVRWRLCCLPGLPVRGLLQRDGSLQWHSWDTGPATPPAHVAIPGAGGTRGDKQSVPSEGGGALGGCCEPGRAVGRAQPARGS